jgi:hypothetical protein
MEYTEIACEEEEESRDEEDAWSFGVDDTAPVRAAAVDAD